MNTMYVNFAGDEKIKRVPSELSTVLPIGLGKGSALTAVKIERGWRLIKSGDSVTVEYGSIPDFCVALGRLYAVKDRLNAEESGEAAFDLEIMNHAGDSFLKEQGIRWSSGPYMMTIAAEPARSQE